MVLARWGWSVRFPIRYPARLSSSLAHRCRCPQVQGSRPQQSYLVSHPSLNSLSSHQIALSGHSLTLGQHAGAHSGHHWAGYKHRVGVITLGCRREVFSVWGRRAYCLMWGGLLTFNNNRIKEGRIKSGAAVNSRSHGSKPTPRDLTRSSARRPNQTGPHEIPSALVSGTL